MSNTLKVYLVAFLAVQSVDVQADSAYPKPYEWYAILSGSSGKALDVRTNYTAIHPFAYLGSQVFKFKPVIVPGFGTQYEIVEHDNDMLLCLDDDFNTVVLRPADSLVVSQFWIIKKIRSDEVHIINAASNKCLDVFKDLKHAGNKVTTWTCSNYPYNQYWTLLKLC